MALGVGRRVSPGCLKCKFIRPHGAVCKSWWRSGYFWAAQGSGEQRVFQNSSIVFPLPWSLLPISPRGLLGRGSSLKVLPDHVDVVAFQERGPSSNARKEPLNSPWARSWILGWAGPFGPNSLTLRAEVWGWLHKTK